MENLGIALAAETISILRWNIDTNSVSGRNEIEIHMEFFAGILIALFVIGAMSILLVAFIIFSIYKKDYDKLRPDIFLVYRNAKDGCGCCDPHFLDRSRVGIGMKDMQAWYEELMEYRIEKEAEWRKGLSVRIWE
jgi:hypothetical protein